jgi:hypothetical protein
MRISLFLLLALSCPILAQRKKDASPWVTPALPDGKMVATDSADVFLKPTATLKDGVTIAKTRRRSTFSFIRPNLRGQTLVQLGDSLAINGKYYASIGDHHAANGREKDHTALATSLNTTRRRRHFGNSRTSQRFSIFRPGTTFPARFTAGWTWAMTVACTSPRIAVRPR